MNKTAKLTGVRGWLLFYLVLPGTLGGIFSIWDGIEMEDSFVVFTSFVQFGLAVAGFNMREPWIRTGHQVYWGVMGFLSIAAAIIVEMPADELASLVGMAIGTMIWFLYWTLSRRVKLTYNVVSAREAELSLMDE